MSVSDPRRRPSARLLCAAAAAVLVLTAGCGTDSNEATLKPTQPESTFTGPPLTAKDRNFHQALYLDYPGAEIRVLDATALTSPNVTFLGAVVVWPRDLKSGNVGGGPKFPPPGIRAHHGLGEAVPAAETSFVREGSSGPASVTVVLGFRLDGTENGAVNGMRIVYEVDGERKTELHRIAMIACPPPKGCRGAGFGTDPDFEETTLRRYGLLPE